MGTLRANDSLKKVAISKTRASVSFISSTGLDRQQNLCQMYIKLNSLGQTPKRRQRHFYAELGQSTEWPRKMQRPFVQLK
jgi:hypothetical protein